MDLAAAASGRHKAHDLLFKNIKPKKPKKKDTSMEVVLSYAGLDLDFGTIDYSGISYFIDGVEYFTDASGIIQHVFNNEDDHTFTLLWHGVLTTFAFNTTINEAVILETKEVEVNSLWNEIFTSALDIDFEVWYYDGTTWSLIENATTSILTGEATILGLVMGSFVVCQVGGFNALNNFTIDQLTTVYTTDFYVDADKTIIDIEYIGGNIPVDLSLFSWEIGWEGSQWYVIANTSYDGIIINEALGTITIYNIQDIAWKLRVFDYAGVPMTEYSITNGGLLEIELSTKSLSASLVWSSDGISPVVGMDLELFLWNGTDFESIGTYVSDVSGIITVPSLIMGTYKLNDFVAFDIVASDLVKIEAYSVESQLEAISASYFLVFKFTNTGTIGKYFFFILWS
ncbi:hypothetical protein LCGC14_2015520 [marine sediment metagenome]|uniref:Uncharacterized protein n=1 Tax=marine sediment metagenome TaxID=412755 RepID=A0A0F9HCF2_9ZZZZ